MKSTSCLLIFLTCCVAAADERPNIMWVSVEDISSHLGCYGDPNANTPNLDKLASQGVRYTHAFTPHGVCAPCRTGIITGMYAMSVGANHMRSKANYPDSIRLYPEYLRDAGYYCTNNSKTDYNLKWNESDVWDENGKKAHWKNRPDEDQPFFAIFNLTTTHESRIWPKNWKNVVKNLSEEELHDPDDMQVPDLYPDTPKVRAAHARLQDIITSTDKTIGKLLKELEDSGLADDTIVIFWSDHGNGFPRAKRWVYDSGTRVPMIARVPEKFRVAGQAEPGSVSDQLINLIDLGPTTMHLAGVSIPDNMHGQPFLGADLPAPRKYVFSARDRVDERFDMVRSVRGPRFRYLRNLNPWRPALQHINYSENSEVRQEMRRLLAEGNLDEKSAQFFQTPRPAEELYDSEKDPWELNNLAKDPAYASQLQELRDQCDEWQLSVRDAHLIPEAILAAEEKTVGDRWSILHKSENGKARTQRLLELAKLAAGVESPDVEQLKKGLKSDDPAARWWAVNGLASLHGGDNDFTEQFVAAAKDDNTLVKIAATRGLHLAGKNKKALRILLGAVEDPSPKVRHAALIQIDDMGEEAAPAKSEVAKLKTDKRNKGEEYIQRVQEHIMKTLNP